MKKISKGLKAIGFWTSDSEIDNFYVDPESIEKSKTTDNRVVNYLKSGKEFNAYFGYSYCRFNCGIGDRYMGGKDLFDGTFVWPEGLFHYIDKHEIKLPNYFLYHIERNNYQVPPCDPEDYRMEDYDFSDWVNWGKKFKKKP